MFQKLYESIVDKNFLPTYSKITVFITSSCTKYPVEKLANGDGG